MRIERLDFSVNCVERTTLGLARPLSSEYLARTEHELSYQMSKNPMPNTEVGRSERTRSPRANTTHGLGPPVLLEGEDQAHYTELLQKVTAAVEPGDIIEEFWVRDVVDLLWEALRLRRLKAALLASSLAGGLKRVLLPAVGYIDAGEWSRRW